MTKEQFKKKMDGFSNVVMAESTLDTLIQEFGETPSEAYALLRKGLDLLQDDLEEAGIKGYWMPQYENKA